MAGSSGVEQSPEKACVGGANPSEAPRLEGHLIKLSFIKKILLARNIKKKLILIL